MTLRLDWCSHEAAKYAVEHWHYSRRLVSTFTRPIYIGVWESGQFVGAIVFSHGANNNIGRPYGETQFSVVELVRVALRQHETPVSRMFAIAFRMLKKQSPGVRLIVSYADEGEGHHGGIYQAGGWVYTGSSMGTQRFEIKGRLMHPRAVDCTVGRAGHKRVDGTIKHKYLMPLDAAMRAQIAPLAKPYPRRSRLESEAPAHQAGDEGAAMRPIGSKSDDSDG